MNNVEHDNDNVESFDKWATDKAMKDLFNDPGIYDIGVKMDEVKTNTDEIPLNSRITISFSHLAQNGTSRNRFSTK